ncbi:glycosyltransferase family 20 protein [Gonapodya prolifera JEL478]|uniref:alpha,alpha-trehalose-phosphate synthase (UDP-forming) n=1 Tax=Gonapodya prolifera (strain JEL478) TaxID=1344416 RepID=A0A139AWG4_GONPJ|nr:glycosyltransferase family 20 protein [Gonapodya prolifera JEL478]|eukprot:KXS21082.1 glycosyltransferase family 20 protein [Gonapodya prolifera JEL478]
MSAEPDAGVSASLQDDTTAHNPDVISSNGAQRLLVVSNRLPVTISSTPENTWKYKMSSGGLVSALEGVRSKSPQLRDHMVWIGWPGADFAPEDQVVVQKELMESYNCLPVFIPDHVADLHYNGFSNSILWPLFHYYPGEINFNSEYWDAYTEANKAFADALVEIVQEGDLVWIHDYHLMLLPTMLRERLNAKASKTGAKLDTVKIGFFLHIPFPSSEVYRILPVRDKVLEGVLSADLVGFHTYDYARHFLSSCTRILSVPVMANGVEIGDRFVEASAVPIGIDTHKFIEALEDMKIQERVANLEQKFKGMKVLVGVDRLDYIKGVPQKLHAVEAFLEKYPEYIGKLVLVQVAVPSRQDVQEYQNLRHIVNELVGRINGRFGSFDYVPIHFMHKSVTFDELVALYRIADVCVVTSTRDGMNLVSYEYIASQKDKHGVLILSEFAGAAQSLDGAELINPWDTDDITRAMHKALEMSDAQRKIQHEKLFKYVSTYTASFWGEEFVKELQRVSAKQTNRKELPLLNQDEVITKFISSPGKKFVFLDYDGTLMETTSSPDDAKPDDKVHVILKELNAMRDVYVYVFSGRGRKNLDDWLGDTGVGLVAEHGCFVRHPRKDEDEILRQEDISTVERSYDDDDMTFEDDESEDNDLETSHAEHPDAQSDTTVTLSVDSSRKSLCSASTLNVGKGPVKSPSDTFQIGSPTGTVCSASTDKKGQFIRVDSDGWLVLTDKIDIQWKEVAKPVLQHYEARTQNSKIEEKEVNMTWHYRNVEPEFGKWQASELRLNLEKILSRMPVSVFVGDKTLELRPSVVDKAAAAKAILKDGGISERDFILYVGDGSADESLFTYLAEIQSAFIATVGKKRTEARAYLETPRDLEDLLSELLRARKDLDGPDLLPLMVRVTSEEDFQN